MEYKGSKLRHELKYYINYNEYNYLKTRLATLLKHDKNSADGGYHIRSLYFDDIYHSSLNEKLSGIEFRQKYRIRIYNKEDRLIKLECKSKFGEYISKTSVPINRDNFYSLINGGDINFLAQSPHKMCKDMFIAIKTRFLSPAVIVDYEREVFVLDEGNVRITFDKDLSAAIDTVDVFCKDMHTVGAMEPGLMILEIKYDEYLPNHVKKLLQISSYERCAISKYVICRLKQFQLNPSAKYKLPLYDSNMNDINLPYKKVLINI